MKIYRFSVFLVFITFISLLYVHQQTQLLKMSYEIESNEKQFISLLDHNRTLVYNITRLKSPVYLQEKFLTNQKEYRIPQKWQVVELSVPGGHKGRDVLLAKNAAAPKQNRVAAMFKSFLNPREALAKTLK